MRMYEKEQMEFIFCQTNLRQEAINLTAGDGGPSTGCQTHLNA